MGPKDILGTATTSFLQDGVVTVSTALTKAPVGVDVPAPTEFLSTIISTTTTALAAAVTKTTMASTVHGTGGGPEGGPGGDEGSGECRLLGSFAVLVQLALGGLALLSLVFKRYRERPQRPLKIWAFDASKQVVGSILVHMANVFMSMLTSGRFSIKVEPMAVQTVARLLRRDDDIYVPNPCSFYLLNLAIDVSLKGMVISLSSILIGCTDDNRNTHLDYPSSCIYGSCHLYPIWKAGRVRPVWKLRQPT